MGAKDVISSEEKFIQQCKHLEEFARSDFKVIEHDEKREQRLVKKGIHCLGEFCDNLDGLIDHLSDFINPRTTIVSSAGVALDNLSREIIEQEHKRRLENIMHLIKELKQEADFLHGVLDEFRKFKKVNEQQLERMQKLFKGVFNREAEAVDKWRKKFEARRSALKHSGDVLSPDEEHKVKLLMKDLERELHIVADVETDDLTVSKNIFWIEHKTGELVENFMDNIDVVNVHLANTINNIDRSTRKYSDDFMEVTEAVSHEHLAADKDKKRLEKAASTLDAETRDIFRWLYHELEAIAGSSRYIYRQMTGSDKDKLSAYEKKLFAFSKRIDADSDKNMRALKKAIGYAHALSKLVKLHKKVGNKNRYLEELDEPGS